MLRGMGLLAAVQFDSPILWACFIGWIMSVVIHEFAHGIVAHWGGDYTIRERGGLTLNPLQYIDPFGSLILPAIIFLIGGVPLPGAATYIRTDLLRSKLWESAVSAAGPISNVLIGLVCLLPLVAGWVPIGDSPVNSTPFALFLGTMVLLQALAVMINLLPVPPLDGFGIIRPYFDRDFQEKTQHPQVAFFGILIVFFILTQTGLFSGFIQVLYDTMIRVGVDPDRAAFPVDAFNFVLFGRT